MHLFDPGGLLDLADGVDDAGMAARSDHDKSPVFHVVSGGVLSPEDVLHQVTRLGFHFDRAGREVEARIAV